MRLYEHGLRVPIAVWGWIMNEKNKPLPVEPLMYEGMPQASIWRTVYRTIGWVGILVGIARISQGVSTLWFYLLIVSPASPGSSILPLAKTMYVTQSCSFILLGGILLVGVWGMLSRSFAWKGLLRVNEWAVIVVVVGFRAALMTQWMFGAVGISMSRVMQEAVSTIAAIGMNCAFSALVLWLFTAEERIQRSSD
jgi:hypothetical protein